MLGIMRKYKQSPIIKLVFIVIVLSFIGTIFLVWGRGDKGMGSSAFAAKVNGAKISYEDFQRSYYRLRGIYEQINGKGLTPEIEKQIGLKKLAIDNLVDTALIRKEAGRMGIKVSKDDIQKAIAAVPAFQKNGAFDFQQYQEVLRMNRLTPSQFEDEQEQDLLIQKARQKIKESAVVSDDEALQLFRKQNDRIDLAFASFSPAELKGEIKLSEQDLNAYLQAHQEQFKTPAQVSVAYCIIDPARVAAKLTVSDAEAQTFYQKNIDRYQGKGGILPYAEVEAQAKADALAFKGAKQAYEMAADAINKNKAGDIAAAAASLGLKVTETPLFTAAAPANQLAGEPDVVKRAFALKQGELGGPVETRKGIYILTVKEMKPAAVPPLAQVKGRVEQGAREEKAKELASQKAQQAVAELAKPAPGLKLQETGPFGYSAKGDIPRIGTSPAAMDASFSLTAAAPVSTAPLQIGDRWYAIKLKSRTEMNKEAFPQEKEKIKQGLLPKKQQEALDKWVKELRAKAKIEINPALLAD
ncbi:MAG TPA: SurA N-terminal domain-containing protein [Geobacteraceae bacterium]